MFIITVYMEEGPTRIVVGCKEPADDAFTRLKKDPKYPGTTMEEGAAPERDSAELARAKQLMVHLYAN